MHRPSVLILIAAACAALCLCSNPKKPAVADNPEVLIEIVTADITVSAAVPVNTIETVTLTFYHGDLVHERALIDFTETDRVQLHAEDVAGNDVSLVAEGTDAAGNLVAYGYLDIGSLHPEESTELSITLDWFILTPATSGLPVRYVNGVCTGASGDVWVAADSIGVCRFDGGTWKTYGTAYGLPAVQVNAVLCDMAGRVWAGTDAGAYLRAPDGMWGAHDSLPSAVVRTIAENPADGVLYFGTAEHGLYRMAPDGSWANPMNEHTVECIAFAGGDSVWCGTADRGLFLVTDSVEASYGTADGLPAVMVVALCSGPPLWIGTTGGLAALEGGTVSPQTGSPFQRGGVQDVRRDAAGAIWAVSRDLVYVYDGGWTAFRGVLKERQYHHIHIDSGNRKWISTRGNGILLHTGP